MTRRAGGDGGRWAASTWPSADQQKRLVVCAFDRHRMIYVLDHVPVVQLV